MSLPVGGQTPQLNPQSLAMSQDFQSLEAQGLVATGFIKSLDGLSQAEKTELIQEAKVLLSDPQLPVGDQAKLQTWIHIVSNFPVDLTPSVTTQGAILDKAPKHNPYMDPGVMALIFPMISEIMKVTNAIVMQSSKLDQAMIHLTISMAKEIYNLAVAAGKMRADMLRADAAAHFTQAAMQLIQAAVTAVGTAMITKGEKGAQNEVTNEYKTQKTNLTEKYNSDIETAKNNNQPTGPITKEYNAKLADLNMTETKAKLQVSSEWQNKQQVLNSMTSQIGGALSGIAQGVVDMLKAGMTEQEAVYSATSQMLDKLSSVIQQTMQKADEAGRGAVQFLEQMNSLIQQYQSQITQSMYRG